MSFTKISKYIDTNPYSSICITNYQSTEGNPSNHIRFNQLDGISNHLDIIYMKIEFANVDFRKPVDISKFRNLKKLYLVRSNVINIPPAVEVVVFIHLEPQGYFEYSSTIKIFMYRGDMGTARLNLTNLYHKYKTDTIPWDIAIESHGSICDRAEEEKLSNIDKYLVKYLAACTYLPTVTAP